jgi:hypothetical protein
VPGRARPERTRVADRCWSPEAADFARVASNRVAIRVQADLTTIAKRGFACLMNLFARASQMTTTSKQKLSAKSFRQGELHSLNARIESDSRGRRTFMARLRWRTSSYPGRTRGTSMSIRNPRTTANNLVCTISIRINEHERGAMETPAGTRDNTRIETASERASRISQPPSR